MPLTDSIAPTWREALVVFTGPAAVCIVFCLLWYGVIGLLQRLYLLVLTSGPQVQQVSIYFLSVQYTLLALSLGFQGAVAIRVGTWLKRYGQDFWKKQTPPYRQQAPPPSTLPIVYGYITRSAKRAATRWFGAATVLVVTVNFVYFEWLYLAEATLLERAPSPSLEVIWAVLTYLTTIPVTPLGQGVIDDLGSHGILVHILLVWLPAIPLVLGFMNLNALLYQRVRTGLFELFFGDY